MSDSKRKDEDKDKDKRELRLDALGQKPSTPTSRSISVDTYSLASQRRAIAYGRARGRS